MLQAIQDTADKINYSGTLLVTDHKQAVLLEGAFGEANRADNIPNRMNTRFGIASGCKLFTAIAVGQLVEQGLLNWDSRLTDMLHVTFPHFSDGITLHHLLSHSSGIPDYFNEEFMEDFEELWRDRPMYMMRSLRDFLPLFGDQPMLFEPGERFHYNNAGYIVLGLIIEQHSGMSYTQYIEEHVFKKCHMTDSGYFAMDQLPGNTAFGYIDEEDGSWRTNIYSLPIKGGSDGGAYVTDGDMLKLWEALLDHKLLTKDTTERLLTPHMQEDEEEYYGYGVWITQKKHEVMKVHIMGYDPGVCFHSAVYPKYGKRVVVTSNRSTGAYTMLKAIEDSWEIEC